MSNLKVEPLNTKASEFKPDPEMFVCMDKTGCYHVSWGEERHRAMMQTVGADNEARYVLASPALPAVDSLEWQRKLLELVSQYFDLGYAEGVAQRAADTMAGDAQWTLSEISAVIGQAASLISSQKQEIERLTHERDEYQNVISSPEAVIANMKRGGIPVPSIRFLIDLHGDAALATWDKASAAESRVQSLEEEVKRLRRESTDRDYMLEAYGSMLGPTALKVVEIWAEKHVKRVHHSWGPEAINLSGEERAQLLLDWEAAMETAVEIRDIDSHLSQGGN